MSTREPMWFCHECHAEMRPLMVPYPICASCDGTFVEKLENPDDDPRNHRPTVSSNDMPDLLTGLQTLLGLDPLSSSSRSEGANRIQFTATGPTGSRTFSFGGPSTISGRSAPFLQAETGRPTMAQHLNRGDGLEFSDQGNITGNMMASYLRAMLTAQNAGITGHPFAELLNGVRSPAGGQLGDYVFNQEALDQIMAQLMDSSNVGRPVAAPEDVIDKLPRTVLEVDSPLLSKNCAVCKDSFTLNTDDPDEQVIITLPCKHAFHETCILPWIKNSGTCPVCRYALVPQPEAHEASRESVSDNTRQQESSGFLASLFGRPSGPGAQNNSNRNTNGAPPGAWQDEALD